MKRVFLIVLDSVGIGNAPDAEKFGDYSANTLKSISKSPYFSAKNLINLGLGNIDSIDYLDKTDSPKASFCRLEERSAGKDTTIGHWEISGIISENPLPTFPNGFPEELINKFSNATGRGVLCNKPYSGTKVINDYGKEHLESGKLIVYTSADSVFQIAAHEDIVPTEKLYDYCRIARKMLVGKYGVGRVIARPFFGQYPNFKRTSNRHDFSLLPPHETILDNLSSNGYDTISVGKINDIFAGKGIKKSFFTHGNDEGMKKTAEIADTDFNGLCFINLVDFDMLYGHRNDRDGYAKAFAEFDEFLPQLLGKLHDDDILMITADHGCDPCYKGTDHTRECVPLIVFGKKISSVNLGTRKTYADIAATIADIFSTDFISSGTSFLSQCSKNNP